jgi:hypothetical protein
MSVSLIIISGLNPSLLHANVDKAYTHLYEVMDKYHQTFDVYTDMNAGGNHFYPTGWMGDDTSLAMDEGYTLNCHSGTSCIKVDFTAKGRNWSAVYWQEPEKNWAKIPNAGYDLTNATDLTFKVRGENGNEIIEFFMGGIQGIYPDSVSKQSTGWLKLSKEWKTYTISLRNKDLSHIIGGFGFALNAPNNKNGATFYIDDIQYQMKRLDTPRFLRSYETVSSNILFDTVMSNACFTYDNALALLAFLARGNRNDLKRAKILADTFCYVLENDRKFSDGRLRNAYKSGDIINHQTKKADLPGWWNSAEKKWCENKFDVSTHTGNVVWGMLALLSYYEKVSKDSKYLIAIEKMANWVENNAKLTEFPTCYGFAGGLEGHDDNQQVLMYKSTEHNIDAYAAFIRLYHLTGNERYKESAMYALEFVKKMWNAKDGHFWTGTTDPCHTLNKATIPLDIHPWAVMAMPTEYEYRKGLIWAYKNCYTQADGFKGFDFNNDRDGVWFEGTAQMAVAFQMNNEMEKAHFYEKELEKAQTTATNNNKKGIVAASHDGVSTGFDWKYFSRLHIGATAWYIFSKLHYNPYSGKKINEVCDTNDPQIVFNHVPPYENRIQNLKGQVCNVDPKENNIAVYVYVSGWLTKPYWNTRTVNITPEGQWECDITTGTRDYRATRISAFVIPKHETPPIRSGELNLPQSLYDMAITHKSIMRIGVPEKPCESGKPSIELTYTPKIEEDHNLIGRACNVIPKDYKVAVYIYVHGWWTKPTYKNPLTNIESDSLFECDITTGGYDSSATKIAAFLVRSGYSPPLCGNKSQLPEDIFDNAVDYVIVER